ncbi:MAG: hypothetical protein ACI909_000503 [Planctomycetota bacterium]|jgi:hypothetical protein
MKKVHSAENSIELGFVMGMLEQDGIHCIVRNQNLAGALGEIPPQECWPEVWITNDIELERAKKIVKFALSPPANSTVPWYCACGEKIEGQFTACWKCGLESSN